MKDVIDDDGRKLKPMSALLLLGALAASGAIVWNAVAHQKQVQVATVATSSASVTRGEIVVKYDPLIQEMQSEMQALGVYHGPLDGVNGERTKQAVTAYQQINGMAQTGIATPELLNHIKFTRKVQAAAQFTGSVAPAATPAMQAPSVAPQAAAIYEAAKVEADAAAKAKQLQIKKVQVALAGLGYSIKKLDGQVSAETRSAILKFEMDNGLDMNGVVDKALTEALKVD